MTIESILGQESGPTHEVVFNCLLTDEINRVKYLCNKYDWYNENIISEISKL